jgi:peptidoglycan hydrolase CwlO-like protein
MKKKPILLLVLVIFLITAGSFFFSGRVFGKSLEELQKEIEETEELLERTQTQKQTLSSEIKQMDQKIRLATLRISQTETSIVTLEEEIDSLSGKIDKLDLSLDKISELLLERVVASYKNSQIDPTFYLLTTLTSTEDFMRNQKYLQVAQEHDQMLMEVIQETREEFDQQKTLKEEKQMALESLKVQLKQQNQVLAQQRVEKARLLEVTKNDESRYQELLTAARIELNQLLSFSSSRGSSCAGEFSSGDTGWYFSQRDSRWCNALIGASDMTVGDVGCLITSVAMVNKSKGADTNPLRVSSNSNYFFSSTAYMLLPFPSLVGSSFREIGKSEIDGQLAANNPVIVHISLGGDGHWIVLVKKDGDSYIINDPWYGPDKKLTDYYSWGLINRVYVLG